MPFVFIFLLFLLFPFQVQAQAQQALAKVEKNDDVGFLKELDLSSNYFSNDTQLGGIFTTGNTESISLSGNSDTLYRIKRWQNRWLLGGYYNRVFFKTNDGEAETIAKYVFGTYRLDYFFRQRTSYFVGGGGYSDEIKGIDLGGTGFTGVSHYFIWTENTALNLSGGYQFVGEDRVDPDPSRELHNAKVEVTLLQRINPYVIFSFNVNTLKDFTDLQELLINSDIEFKIKLHQWLNLIVGFNLRFDNQPTTGFRKLDTVSSLSLGVSLSSASDKKD